MLKWHRSKHNPPPIFLEGLHRLQINGARDRWIQFRYNGHATFYRARVRCNVAAPHLLFLNVLKSFLLFIIDIGPTLARLLHSGQGCLKLFRHILPFFPLRSWWCSTSRTLSKVVSSIVIHRGWGVNINKLFISIQIHVDTTV
jgi:hypothetical protein